MSHIANKYLPIGVFDSGVGGLTVLRALRQQLPHEHFIYLGDTARLPYGTKSADTVRSYALNANERLVHEGIKALVVACNTASGAALGALQAAYPDLPIIGVIEPGVSAALANAHPSGPLIILATEGTVKSQAYSQMIAPIAPGREVIEWPCPLLVALAEEGWCEGELVERIIYTMLLPLLESLQLKHPAGFLLGCTHFPVFKAAFHAVLGQDMPVIDPATKVAEALQAVLQSRALLNEGKEPGEVRFMATDGIDRFIRVAPRFLGGDISLQSVDLVTVAITSVIATEVPSQRTWDQPG